MTGDERLRLFLALRLAEPDLDAVARWQAEELAAAAGAAGARVVPREHLHVTLAFLGSRPARELGQILAALRAVVGDAGPVRLEVDRYRETRSVGMLVLRDENGEAAALAGRLQGRLEALGVYRREARPWLPHLTVLRFRSRPGLAPALPAVGTLVPSDAAAFLSRLHPSGARYEALESLTLGQQG